MRSRVAIVVLLLVVAPVAVLSLLAGRALRDWETIFKRQMELSAGRLLQDATGGAVQALDAALQDTRSTLSDCLRRGGKVPEVQSVATRLARQQALIQRVYLFMNPWGFIYPEMGSDSELATLDPAERDVQVALAALASSLRLELATTRPAGQDLRMAIAGARYGFVALPGRQDLYVGVQVAELAWRQRLAEVAARLRNGGLAVAFEGKDWSVPAEGPGGAAPGGPAAAALVTGRLPAPFADVAVAVRLENPDDVRHSAALQVRFRGLGIFLLAGGILVGTAYLVWAAAEQVRLARARSDMVVGISHDLRTPIASMKLLTESLFFGRVADADRQRQFLGTILRECERVSRLVERVLYLVRFDQDALVYCRQCVDVPALVNEVVHGFADRLATASSGSGVKAGEAVRIEMEQGLASVHADRAALTQLVFNLLDNALKYGRPAAGSAAGHEAHGDAAAAWVVSILGEAVQCRRFMTRETEWVRLTVRDRGAGIAKHDLRRIFRRFYRASSASDLNVSGVGLGLAMCRHIARAHGGWITAQSVLGQGSTFSVYLPVWQGDGGGDRKRGIDRREEVGR